MIKNLTLRLNEGVLVQIKNYAAEHDLSLSKFTENVFKEILEGTETETQNLMPTVKKYRGIIKYNLENQKDRLLEELMEKHS